MGPLALIPIKNEIEFSFFRFDGLFILRKKENREVIVVLNFCDHSVRFDLLNTWVRGIFTEIFSGTTRDFSSMKSFQMKGWEYLVYER